MFNWVCPQCGKDVPPSKTECPNCAERAREAAASAPSQAQSWQPPPPQAWQPAPPVAPPPNPAPPQQSQQQYQQQYPPQYAPPQPPHAHHVPPAPQHLPPPPPPAWQQPAARSAPPTWLMIIAFALAFLGIGAAVYFGIQRFSRSNPSEKAGLENPANASEQKVSNPLQKYVEVVGIRLMPENRKPVAKFVVVNHSNAEITGLAANVTLWASTSRSEEDSIGSFSFKLANLGPNASQEVTEPLKTKMKAYELPDWQNATAEIQITSPQ